MSRIISGVLGIGCAFWAFATLQGEVFFAFVGVIAFALALIWFSDGLGGWTGPPPVWMPITERSPGCVVAFCGWVLLGLVVAGTIFGALGGKF